MVEVQWFVLASLDAGHSLVMELSFADLNALTLFSLLLAPELDLEVPQERSPLPRSGSFGFLQSLPFSCLPYLLLAQHSAGIAMQLGSAGSPLLWDSFGFPFDLCLLSLWTPRCND